MSKRLIQILIFLLTPLLIVVGFSSWIIVGEKSITVGEIPVQTNVCYINEDTSGNQYTRIEKALEVANSTASSTNKITVYVKPGTNPFIYKDCIVGDYVTLCFPYEDKTFYKSTDSSVSGFNWGSGQVFADTIPDTYRKNLITIKENVTVSVSQFGILQIGGVFGNPEVGITGIVNGNYCQLILESKAKIISKGTIQCYGFIKESTLGNESRVEIQSGTLNIPFMIYDFKGGTLTVSYHNENVCPFSIYDIANIQSLLRIYSGSLVQAEYRIEINDEPFSGVVNLIGSANTSNTALRLTKGYLDIKYGTSTLNGTPLTVIEGQTEFNLFGNLSIGSIIMTVKYSLVGSLGVTVDLDTSKYFFPIPYKFKFIVECNSILTVSEKAKMMPGSSILIKEESKLNVNKGLIFYPENYVETRAAAAASNYPSNLSAAEIVNNGAIIVNSSGALGIAGDTNFIKTEVKEATIEIYNSSSVTSNDEVEGENLGTTHSHKQEITGNPYGNLTTNYVSSSREKLDSIYQSVLLSNGTTYAWKELDISNATINVNYYSVYEDGTVEKYTDHGNATSGTVETGLALNVPTKSGYVFKGWYLDVELEQYINNGILSGLALFMKSTNGEINIYASWEKGAAVNVVYKNASNELISGSKYNFQAVPGQVITLEVGIDNYDKLSSDGNVKTEFKFKNWLVDGIELSPGTKFEIPSTLNDGDTFEIIEVADTVKYSKLKYSQSITTSIFGQTIRSQSVSNDGNTLGTGDEIWVKVGSTITVTVYSKRPFYKIKVEIVGVPESMFTKGGPSYNAGGATNVITFVVPENYISISITDG